MGQTAFTLSLPNAIRDASGAWTKEVEIEEMEGDEEDILTDQQRESGGKGTFVVSGPKRITAVLSRCTSRIGTTERPAGSDRYKDPKFFEKLWGMGFTSDRLFTMIRIRQASLGNTYRFSRNCPHCGREVERIRVDLGSDLEVVTKTIEEVSEPKLFTCPKSKDIVEWRYIRGADEDIMSGVVSNNQRQFISAVMYQRLVTVRQWSDVDQAVSEPKRMSDVGGLDYLKRMKSLDRRELAIAMDMGEGGIDTQIKVTCDNIECRKEFSFKLDVMNGDFYFPTTTLSDDSSTKQLSPSAGGGDQEKSLDYLSQNAGD